MSAYELNISVGQYDNNLITGTKVTTLFQMTLTNHNPFAVLEELEGHLQVFRANLEATYNAMKKSETSGVDSA